MLARLTSLSEAALSDDATRSRLLSSSVLDCPTRAGWRATRVFGLSLSNTVARAKSRRNWEWVLNGRGFQCITQPPGMLVQVLLLHTTRCDDRPRELGM